MTDFIARHFRLSLLGLFVFSLIVNLTIALRAAFPVPRLHDEFSYLLAADTFSHGRLTNPTHPMWQYLETFHELQRPSYASKYPPGQGLAMAAGRLILGDDIYGVWLSTAAMVVLCAWMLRPLVGPSAAVISAALFTISPTVVNWSQTYWGGSVAAAGGAMLIGSVLRWRATAMQRDAALLGIAVGILFLSRPYEGMAAVVVALWFCRGGVLPPLFVIRGTRAGRPRPYGALTILAIVAFLGFYNFRVTGSAFSLPYLTYEKQYAIAPPLLFESLRPVPDYRWPELREYAETVEVPHFQSQRSLHGFLQSARLKLTDLGGRFYSPLPLLLLLGMLPISLRRTPALWLPVSVVVAVMLATLASNWTRTQYVAPAVPALLAILAVCATQIQSRFPRLRIVVLVLCVALAGDDLLDGPRPAEPSQRQQLIGSLNHEPGKQLVLVNYLPGHHLDDEWVYNPADIDAAKIVFAHDPGPEDHTLREYFKDRTIWHVDVGPAAAGIRLEPTLK